MDVAGTGGMETYEAIINLFDSNGNPVTTNDTIFFKLVNAPAGTYLTGELNDDNEVSVEAAYGQASITVNSGEVSGTVTLQARTVNANDLEVSARSSNIAVAAGPAAQVQLAIGDNNSGEELGAGIWEVEVSATVNDMHGNPVKEGTVVYFSVPEINQPEEDNMEDDEFEEMLSSISVQPISRTGWENANGDSIPGVAYTTVTYDGKYSMREIKFQVEISVGDGTLTPSSDIVLPFHNLSMDIAPTPGYVDWNDEGGGIELAACVSVEVRDGQNTPINQLTLNFNGSSGNPLMEHTNDSDDHASGDGNMFTEMTGLMHVNWQPAGPEEEYPYMGGITTPGRVYKLWSVPNYQVPDPGPQGPGQLPVDIFVQVLGDDTQDSVTIIWYKY
jgi:hypothetical protein